MARARNLKPGFFTNDLLAECSPLARLLFQGLWCHADRAGRIEDRPRKFKAEILPYDDCDAESLLMELVKAGFVVRYQSGGTRYLAVVNFAKHQNPHIKEPESTIPAPCENGAATVREPDETGSGPADSLNLIPDSLNLIPDSLNLIPEKPKTEVLASAVETPAPGTSAGLVCARLRKAGIAAVNPSHPRLLAMLAAGVTADELAGLAEEPGAKGKGFAWVLAAAEGRRRDAANLANLPPARASPGSLSARNQSAAADAKAMIFGSSEPREATRAAS